jgi:hypothetical protein
VSPKCKLNAVIEQASWQQRPRYTIRAVSSTIWNVSGLGRCRPFARLLMPMFPTPDTTLQPASLTCTGQSSILSCRYLEFMLNTATGLDTAPIVAYWIFGVFGPSPEVFHRHVRVVFFMGRVFPGSRLPALPLKPRLSFRSCSINVLATEPGIFCCLSFLPAHSFLSYSCVPALSLYRCSASAHDSFSPHLIRD